MGLWIRTQNNKRLIECSDLIVEWFYDGIIEKEARETYMFTVRKHYNIDAPARTTMTNTGREHKIYYKIAFRTHQLGIYPTEERALEVLDEIQKFIEDNLQANRTYTMPQE